MANSDKDILITPNTGQSAKPKIEVTGADNSTKTITINDDGTLSFDSTIAATSGSVADGNANLVTGDAVFDYIAAQNFTTSGASNFVIGDITGQAAITSGLASTDEFVISDAGVLKRMDTSVLQNYMQNNLTFTTNTDTQLTTEQVQDIVGAMFTGNTETRVSATYEDGDGTIDLVVDDMTADTNTFRTVRLTGGNILGGTEVLSFTAGSNVSLSESGGEITIASTDTNTQLTLLDEDNMSSNSATAAASQQSIKAYVDSEVAGLVDSAPSALNTLNELAAALGDDASFSTTTATSLGNRLRVDVSNQGLTSTQQGNALTNLGITATLAEINILDDGLAASDIPNLAASKITSGTLGTARIPNLATSKITSGTFADARIAESNVTQHQAALSITESQISDLQSYLTAPRTVTAGGNTLANGETLAFTAGSNVTITESGGAVTIAAASSSGASEAFKTIAVSGQDNVVADSATDTLTFAAGSNVTLTTNASSDTVTIASTDTNTQLSTEQVQDIVGGMFSGNTETRITATYQDGDGTVDLVVDNDLSNYDNSSSGFITSTLTTEQVQDIVGAMFTGNTETRVSATYQDGDGTIDLVVDDMTTDTNTNQLTTFTLTGDSGSNQTIAHGNTLDIAGGDGIATVVGSTDTVTVGLDIDGMTDIGAALADADLMIVDDGAGGTNRKATMSRLKTYMQNGLTFTTDTNLTTEEVQDIVGAMVSGNTESNIAVTYDDTNGKLNFASTDTNTQLTLLDQDDMSSNSATAAASQQSIKAYVDAEVAGLVDSAPSALNTLNELAAALGDDANFSTTTATSLGNRLRIDVSNQGLTGTQKSNALTNLGITASLAEINILDDGLSASDIPNLATSKITSGTFADARIAQSNVTQHLAVGSGGGIGLSGKTFSLDIDGMTDIGAALADADLMIVDDGAGGTNRKATMSRLKTYMQNNLTFTTNTDTQLSNENVMDIAGPLVATGGTKTRIAVTYDDANNNMDFVVDDMNFSVDDITGATSLTSGLASTDEFVINDAGVLKRMDVSVLQSYMQSNLTFTTNTNTQLSNEQVQDIVGGMFSSNTETGITATYQDGDGTIDLVVSGTSPGGSDTFIQYNNGGSFGATTLSFDDTDGSEQFLFDDTSDTALVKIVQRGTGSAFEVHDQASDSSIFKINHVGQVSIKTSTPIAGGLTINDDMYVGQIKNSAAGSASSPRYTFYSDSNTGMYSGGADILKFSTGGTERVKLSSSGLQLGAANAEVTTILDEDDMSTNSDTALATQQSIKAYVDNNAGGIASVAADSTPQLGGDLDVNGNKITSASNADVTIEPNGTGDINLYADTLVVGDSSADFTIQHRTTTNSILRFQAGGNTQLTSDGPIFLNADEAGDGGSDSKIRLNAITSTFGKANNNAVITTQGTGDLTLSTNSGTNSGTIKIADGANGLISLTPNGTGNVALGNFTFNADQTVGSSQDNYVLTYDNSAGTIGLEEASGGGASLANDANNRVVTATGSGGINGEANLTFDGSTLATSGDIEISSQYGRINFKKDSNGNVNNDVIFFINGNDQYAGAIKYFHASNQLRFQANQSEQLYITDGAIYPPVDNDVDLGTSSLKFKNSYFGLVDAENFKVNGSQGSDGQVLTSTGSGVAWENASGGSSTTGSFYITAEESNWQLNVGSSNGFHWSFGNGADIGDAPSTNAKNEGIALPVDCTLKFMHLNVANDGNETAGNSATVQIYKATAANATQSAVSNADITATIATNGHGISATADKDIDFDKGDVILFRSTTANQAGIYIGRGTISAYFVER